MVRQSHQRAHLKLAQAFDPREAQVQGAEVIDLATRSVLPAVSQRKKSDSLGLAFGILIVAGLGGVTLWSMDTARQVESPSVRNPLPSAAPAGREELIPSLPPEAITPAGIVPEMAPQDPFALPPNLARAPEEMAAPGVAPAPAPVPGPAQALVFDASSPVARGVRSPAGTASPSAGGAQDDFAIKVGGTGSTAVAEATFDPASTVTQGTLIPAVLETAINTDVPGFVRAIVSSDVRSFDGARILVPRSSRLIGQYKSGVNGGQKRAYVIWTRLIRPDGVSVNLGSPAIGFGGETGLAGKVNSHFFERFGSAMLLSVVSGLSAIGSGGASVVLGGGQSAAAAAVGQNGQIGPTIRVPSGEAIRVFTAKDLDFSKVS